MQSLIDSTALFNRLVTPSILQATEDEVDIHLDPASLTFHDENGLPIQNMQTSTSQTITGSTIRFSTDTDEQAVWDKTFTWKIKSETTFNEDTGDQRIRLTHTLTADILYTDEITFRVGFTTTGDAANVGKLINKDVAECKLLNNTQQPKFWSQTTFDKHMLIAAAADSEPTTDLTNNWSIPVSDNDAFKPFCTPPDSAASPFACKEIKCVHARALDTSDFFDF